jgi:hypothetical protein
MWRACGGRSGSRCSEGGSAYFLNSDSTSRRLARYPPMARAQSCVQAGGRAGAGRRRAAAAVAAAAPTPPTAASASQRLPRSQGRRFQPWMSRPPCAAAAPNRTGRCSTRSSRPRPASRRTVHCRWPRTPCPPPPQGHRPPLLPSRLPPRLLRRLREAGPSRTGCPTCWPLPCRSPPPHCAHESGLSCAHGRQNIKPYARLEGARLKLLRTPPAS